MKFDGWRCQLVIDNAGVRVFTRRGFDWTDKLKIIAEAAGSELKAKCAIIDIEDYKENHPHSGLKMRSPRGFIRAQTQ